MFRNRTEAGILLAERLAKFKGENGIVLAVPRGGVPVAYQVAKELNMPLEVILTKKIGHPNNKEFAIGAASLHDYFVVPHSGVSSDYVEQELQRIRKRLREMQLAFMGKNKPEDLRGKTVIVVDDGIATGNTLLGTIRLLKKREPAKIIIAVPVAADTSVRKLEREADEVVAVLMPSDLYGIGAYYRDFSQLSDDDVIEYLKDFNKSEKV